MFTLLQRMSEDALNSCLCVSPVDTYLRKVIGLTITSIWETYNVLNKFYLKRSGEKCPNSFYSKVLKERFQGQERVQG